MPRKEKKYHFIYKTTCTVTNRYYIGIHSTDNLEDGYLGSGKRLRYSVNKYGKENHTREILEYFNSREALSKRENEIVNSDLLKESNCMNLVIGGGGFMLDDYHLECVKRGGEVMKQRLENDKDLLLSFQKRGSLIAQRMHHEGKFIHHDWTGLKHSEESKQKVSNSKRGTGMGENNSQSGTCWVNNRTENKKIKLGDLNNWINEGWVKGRIQNINSLLKLKNYKVN